MPHIQGLSWPNTLAQSCRQQRLTINVCFYVYMGMSENIFLYIVSKVLHSYVLVCTYLLLLIAKKTHSHSLLQFPDNLIPPYWQTLEFALSVAHRGQIPS